MTLEEHTEPVSPVEEDTPGQTRGSRRRAIFVLLGVAALIGGLLFFLNTGQETDPSVTPDDWRAPDIAEAQEVALGDGEGAGTIVIGADEKTCWNAYVGSEPLDGCGPAVFRVTGAPRTFGANVKSTESEKAFLGMAIWNEDETQELQSVTTKKRYGTVAVTAVLEPAAD